MENIIEVNNLSFGYTENLIFKNINFSIQNGDFLGIIGPNGCGKSTLLKLILNILTPLSGEIKIFGQSVKSFNDWNKIGYVSQKSNSFNTSFPATVEEVVMSNLFSSIGLFKFPNKEHRKMVYESLARVGLESNGKTLIGNLSGGQQQRVFIARALVNNPKILFLDEPTVGIDAKSQNSLYCLLKKINKDLGITIVMITHDIQEISMHAAKLIYINENGSIYISKDSHRDFIKKIYGYEISINSHLCENCLKKEGTKC